MRSVWTEEEIQIIIDRVNDSIGELMKVLPKRSYYSIACQRSRIVKKYKLIRNFTKKTSDEISIPVTLKRKPWTKEEQKILLEKGPTTPIGKLEMLIPNHSRQVIYNYAHKHNIDILEGKQGRKPNEYGDSCLEYIRHFYPRKGANACASALGLSPNTVTYLARKMGVKKNGK